MELMTGNAMLITGGFVHCVGKFVGFLSQNFEPPVA
jgi:hypothetical protein